MVVRRKRETPVEVEAVRHVPIETRTLLYVSEENFGLLYGVVEGTIVWFVSSGSDAEDVAYREKLLSLGALKVKILPAKSLSEPVPQSAVVTNRSLREIVFALADDVDEDLREEVKLRIEQALAKAGL